MYFFYIFLVGLDVHNIEYDIDAQWIMRTGVIKVPGKQKPKSMGDKHGPFKATELMQLLSSGKHDPKETVLCHKTEKVKQSVTGNAYQALSSALLHLGKVIAWQQVFY